MWILGLKKLTERCHKWVDLATGQERQLTTGKRAERTKHDFRTPICRSAIGQAKLTFLFCC